jgi:uncharacterized membrane protein YeaQ/YmgE (transglycosylase-associated protein family)
MLTGRKKNMFSLIWMLIVGLIVGALAKLIMPGRDPGGIFVTMMLGVAGALIGRLLGRAFGMYAPGQHPGIIMSILGAILLLAIYRLMIHRRVSI